MNHFFALKLTPEAAEELARVSAQWQSQTPPTLRVRWEDPANYHITLNFLGNLSRTQQPRLVKTALPVARRLSPFVIHITRLGAFPSVRAPGVLWAGLAQKKESANVSKQIDKVLVEQGFAVEKHSYVPHITLGRCRPEYEPLGDPLGGIALKTSLSVGIAIPVDHFALMETLPPEARRNGGPLRYNTVHTFPFGIPQS